MKRTTRCILPAIFCLFIISCHKKEESPSPIPEQRVPCIHNTATPVFSLNSEDVFNGTLFSSTICGLIPLGRNYQWIYRDSLFTNGVFTSIQMDTLKVRQVLSSSSDGSVWWVLQSKRFKGMPGYMYSMDTIVYDIYFTTVLFPRPYAKKSLSPWFILSSQPVSNSGILIGDVAHIQKTTHLPNPVTVPYGTFNGCIDVFRPTMQSDIIIKPELGIVKFTRYSTVANPFNLTAADRTEVCELVNFTR